MKRLLKTLVRIVGFMAVLTVVLALLADLYCEVLGLPQQVQQRVCNALADRGIHATFGYLRVGVARGVVLENATFYSDAEHSRPLIGLDSGRLSVVVDSVRERRLLPRSLHFSDASVFLPRAEEDGGLAAHFPVARSLCGRLEFRRDAVQFRDVRGEALGVRFDLSGRVSGLRRSAVAGDGPVAVGRWAEDQLRGVAVWIGEFTDVLAKLDLHAARTLLEMHVEADLSDPDSAAAEGRLLLGGVTVRGLELLRCAANVRLRAGALSFTSAECVLGAKEAVRGSVTFWPASGEIAGEAEGALHIASLLGACPAAVTGLVGDDLHAPGPVTFKGVLRRSPLDIGKWVADGSWGVRALRFRDVSVPELSSEFTLRDAVLSFPKLNGTIAGTGGEQTVAGAVTVWPASGELAATLRTAIYPMQILRGLRVGVPPTAAGLQLTGAPATFEFSLARSPWACRDWSGQGRIAAQAVRIGECGVREFSCSLSVAPNRLTFDDLSLAWAEARSGTVTGAIDVDLARLSSTDVATAGFEFSLHSETPLPEGAAEGYGLKGNVSVRPRARTVAASLNGCLFLDRLYALLTPSLQLPESRHVSGIAFVDPPTVALQLPETSWDLEDWQVSGHVSGGRSSYRSRGGQLQIARFEAEAAFSGRGFRFEDIDATLVDGTHLTVPALSLSFRPVVLKIEGVVRGNPGFVEVFIEHSHGRHVYNAIWRDIRWCAESPPTFSLDFIMWDGPRLNDWGLRMTAKLDVAQAVYRGMATDRIQLAVGLRLPERITVSDIVVERGEARVCGDVGIILKGASRCTFEVKGTCDPRDILHGINPKLAERFRNWDFAEDSEVVCNGAFFLGDAPRLRLSGELDSPQCSYKLRLDRSTAEPATAGVSADAEPQTSDAEPEPGRTMALRFQDFSAEWEMSDDQLSWKSIKGHCSGGQFDSTGYYDSRARAGLVALAVDDVGVAELLSEAGFEQTASAARSKLTGTCRLQILRDWSGIPLLLTGNGKVHLSEADLWRVPVFNQLGKLLDVPMLSRLTKGKVSNLGSITEIDAALDFKGDRVVIPKLRTNGTIVSLSGHGEYALQNRRIHLRVKGETLRQIRLLSLAFKPLSWIFDAELNGTIDDHKWRLISGLERFLSGKTDPEDRLSDQD